MKVKLSTNDNVTSAKGKALLREFLEEWKIPKSVIAAKTGITLGNISSKVYTDNRLLPKDVTALIKIFEQLQEDAYKVSENLKG